MIGFRIERARLPDWRRIRAIRLRALVDAPDAFGTRLAEDEARPDAEWQARADNEKVAHFLASTPNGSGVGVAVGAPYTDNENTAGLFAMWVAPEARGQGVGSALVEAVIAWARHENYKRILLDVADANNAAIRLYESHGFLRNGKTGTLPRPRQHITEHQRFLNLE